MGKLTFSSGAGGRSACLAVLALQDGMQDYRYFPAMIADAEASKVPLTSVYKLADGSFRLLINDRWIGLDRQAGCLTMTDDLVDAAMLRLSGVRLGQTWDVLVEDRWLPVVFYPQTPQAVLTINQGKTTESRFEPSIVTPSLAALVASKDGRGADLTGVVLEGASAVGVDFTEARFTRASLQGADFSNCRLTRADLREARLDGVLFKGAVLDHVSMSNAILGAPGWGVPSSAKGIDLSHCRANGAILGGTSATLDCTEANLTGGDFTGADLRGLQLKGARLLNATLAGCRLDGALLEGADLTGVFAQRASLRKCTLKNIIGSNANFTAADFSNANLSQARLDAKVHLLSLPLSYAGHLKQGLPDETLLAAFRAKGLKLPADLSILPLVPALRWQLGERKEGYLLINTGVAIDVFQTNAALQPAVFYKAICLNTKASGAQLGGADLRGVQWYGTGATLDHADLEDAALSNGLLVSLDLSQAFLSGADLSNSVLVGARIAGCTVLPDAGSRAFSLDGAQIQGADFSDTTLVDGLLINAGVSLEQGVPLFTLPLSAKDDLTPEGIARLAPVFAQAGYPLGPSPTLDSTGEDLKVRPSATAGIAGPFGYTTFRVVQRESAWRVFGVGPLLMRDWKQYPSGLAFKATEKLESAMSLNSIGPAGYPMQALSSGALDPEGFFTAMKG